MQSPFDAWKCSINCLPTDRKGVANERAALSADFGPLIYQSVNEHETLVAAIGGAARKAFRHSPCFTPYRSP
jgi:hypothetical protein